MIDYMIIFWMSTTKDLWFVHLGLSVARSVLMRYAMIVHSEFIQSPRKRQQIDFSGN
jgi:hypothetical protein